MKSAVYTTCTFSAVVCLALMLLGILGSSALLQSIRTPEEVFADSALYLNIYVWGLPFVFFYFILFVKKQKSNAQMINGHCSF